MADFEVIGCFVGLLILITLLVGCKPTEKSATHITCFSGNLVILDTFADESGANFSNGTWYYKDIMTHMPSRFTGTCKVDN